MSNLFWFGEWVYDYEINDTDWQAWLIIKAFVDYCTEREEFNSRDKFILWEAYLDYMNNKF